MEEENGGRGWRACLAIEDGDAVVDGDGLDVGGGRCHVCYEETMAEHLLTLLFVEERGRRNMTELMKERVLRPEA